MRIKIEFEIDLPDNIKHTEDELEEFLRFEYGDRGSMSLKNPFDGEVPDTVFGTFYWGYE